jgi:radical SAM protein with 4Fe4S-binding SPASM domain
MINISKLYCGIAGESDHLRYERGNNFGPIVVYNCTSRCNLKCRHCYNCSGSAAVDGELTTEQAKKFIADIKKVNAPVILFSGGEPLLREDLFELINTASSIGIRTVISTNGTLINKEIAKKIRAAGVSYAGISLDGIEPFHDEFRGMNGAFKKTLEGISCCINEGIKTGLRFTITKGNFSQIDAVFKIAADAGIKRICFYHLIRTGRAAESDNYTLTSGQTRDVMEQILAKTSEYVSKKLVDEVLSVGNHADGPFILLKLAKESEENFQKAKELLEINKGNRIGEKIACVRWDGTVHADQFWLNYCLGNVKDKSFDEIWLNSNDGVLQMLRNKDKYCDKRCGLCKWFSLCKGNFRFLGNNSGSENWLNEPPCYLRDSEIGL